MIDLIELACEVFSIKENILILFLSSFKYHLNIFETSPISTVNDFIWWFPGEFQVLPLLSEYFIAIIILCVFLRLITTMRILIYLFLELCIISRSARMAIISHFHSYDRLVIYFHSGFSSGRVKKMFSKRPLLFGRVILKFLFLFTYYSKSSRRPIL